MIEHWEAYDWKMSFNIDQQKQAIELKFVMERVEVNHLKIRFSNKTVKTVGKHNHIEGTLDPKLSCSAHIKAMTSRHERVLVC